MVSLAGSSSFLLGLTSLGSGRQFNRGVEKCFRGQIRSDILRGQIRSDIFRGQIRSKTFRGQIVIVPIFTDQVSHLFSPDCRYRYTHTHHILSNVKVVFRLLINVWGFNVWVKTTYMSSICKYIWGFSVFLSLPDQYGGSGQYMSSFTRSIWGRLLKVDSWVPSLFLTSASKVIGRLEPNLSDQVADDGVEYEHGQHADKDEDHCVLMIANMIE